MISVVTESGLVQGRADEGVASFRAIPYGASVDARERFRAPRAVQPADGTWDANTTARKSVQGPGTIFDTLLGEYFAGGPVSSFDLQEVDDENCLELSVLAPVAHADAARPVMVYLHGGGFAAGSNVLAANSSRFVRETDVVLVGVNHRLGIWGFLPVSAYDPAYALSANCGLQDLVLALKWVRANIAEFGGDPNNVTIFGESGGGAKVACLLSMPSASGLFHRAIIESGADVSFPDRSSAAKTVADVLRDLGIAEDHQAIESLQQIPTARLLSISHARSGQFVPYIDGTVLPVAPFSAGWTPVNNVPLIVGCCLDELTWFAPEGGLTDENSADRLRAVAGDEATAIESEYGAGRDSTLRALSDASFGAFMHAARHAMAEFAPVWTYVFTWQTPVGEGAYGAFHTAELPLVLRHVQYPESEAISRQLSQLWAAFARAGTPTASDVTWPREDGTGLTLIVDTNGCHWGEDPTHPAFWRSLPSVHVGDALQAMLAVGNGAPSAEFEGERG